MKNYYQKMAEMTPEERSKYFKKLGSKGGQATKKRGPKYFSDISKKGWERRLQNNEQTNG